MGTVGVAAGCEIVTGLSDARQAVTSPREASTMLGDAATPDEASPDAESDAADPGTMQADAGFTDSRWVVSSLRDHTCAVGPDQRAYCWGDNSEGQLGDGTTEQRNQPVPVGTFTDVISVSAGYTHSCLVRANGDVYCWGKNDRGQLGDGTKTDRHVPSLLSTSYALKVGVAGWHTCVLTNIGSVRCWGDNYYGALGDGTFTASTSYVDVKGLSNVGSLGVGVMHNCAVTTQGKVYCWGRAFFGETGYLVDGGNGSTDPSDPGSPNAVEVPGLTNATGVVAGEDDSCATRVNGDIVCWGRNDYAQYGGGSYLGGPTPFKVPGVTFPTRIAAGKYTVCGTFSGRVVRCWGENNFGQLGNNNTVYGTYVVSPPVSGIANVTALSTNEHTCAWQHDPATKAVKMLCWGRNDLGQLGIGRTSDYELVPQEVIFPPSMPQVAP